MTVTMTGYMMTLHSPHPGEIWLAYVSFADQPDIGKVRPILVVTLANTGDAVVAAKITTSPTWPGSEYAEISNWKECGLRKPSYVQIKPLFEIRIDQLLRDTHLGELPNDVLRSIINQINATC